MLVRLSDTQQVNTDHVVNVAQPNANDPNNIVISLSNARQVVTDAAGHAALEEAMCDTGPAMMAPMADPPIEDPMPSSDVEVGV